MKKLYTLIILMSSVSLFAQDLVMTVSVPPGTTSCRISGAFWGWDPNGGPVGDDNGNDTFTFTLSPAPGADMEYLFTLNGSGAYENLIDNAANAECTDRVTNGNLNTDYFSYANRIWKTTDALIWNEIYDDCSEANLSVDSRSIADFKLFPNPTQNIWTVKSNNQNIQLIEVFDILGKQVYSSRPNAVETVIESNDLSKGVYFAKVKTANRESNIRLVKN